jgi:hypothetical protein
MSAWRKRVGILKSSRKDHSTDYRGTGECSFPQFLIGSGGNFAMRQTIRRSI